MVGSLGYCDDWCFVPWVDGTLSRVVGIRVTGCSRWWRGIWVVWYCNVDRKSHGVDWVDSSRFAVAVVVVLRINYCWAS